MAKIDRTKNLLRSATPLRDSPETMLLFGKNANSDQSPDSQPQGATVLASNSPAEPSAAHALVGESFDGLELAEEIGRGGMGIVFKAKQKSLERYVAVKLLLREHSGDPVRLARFYAEARAAALFVHPNIVQIYQVGQCRFGHYFVMEYIDGLSLDSLIEKGALTVASAVAMLNVLASAVHYAHGKGLIHRDLKPSNIMIDRSGRPVVMDFGIVKFVGQSASLTQQGVVMGTPAYMAPEQAHCKLDQIGPPSDVYSLGALLYALLTGRPPYEGDTALATILKVIGPEMPTPVRELCSQVPRELDRICMKCLAKRPGERYKTARALADDLRRLGSKTKLPGEPTPCAATENDSTVQSALPKIFLISKATKKSLRVLGARVSIGRSSGCDIVLRASDVSKHHCQILVQGHQVLVEDLASANGISVNGKSVERTSLKDGDLLRVANHEFLVRFASSSTRLQE
jgi:serine/threonine protein kinase